MGRTRDYTPATWKPKAQNQNFETRHAQDEADTLLHVAVACNRPEAYRALRELGADDLDVKNVRLLPAGLRLTEPVGALIELQYCAYGFGWSVTDAARARAACGQNTKGRLV